MGILDRVEARLASQVGFVEGTNNQNPYGAWYGVPNQPYCAMGICWGFGMEGAAELVAASTSKGFAYTPAGAQWFRNQGRAGSAPRRGALAFFDFPGDGVARISHVGFVTDTDGALPVATIEFNTSRGTGGSQRDGGGCWRRSRSSGIVVYGYPDYEGFDARHGEATPPPPPPATTPDSYPFRVSQFQSLVGVKRDGDFGPVTTSAANRQFIGWQEEVRRRGSRADMAGNRNLALVRWLKDQLNRKFNAGLDPNSSSVGPTVNHFIVNGLGQGDGICGANGFRAACQ